MSDPTNVVIQNGEYYLRIVTIVNVCVKEALLAILHDPTYNGLPLNDEQQTHALLLAFKTREERNLRRVLKPHQWDIICHVCTTCAPNCPRAGRTDTKDFDITIICVLLSNYLVGLPPPINGWAQPLAPGDNSKGAYSIRLRDLRNRTIGHGSIHQFATQKDFDDCYNEIEKMLLGIGYNNMQLFIDLKTSSLDPYVQDQIKFLSCEVNTMEHELNSIKTFEVAIKTTLASTTADLNLCNAKQNDLEYKQNEFVADQNLIKAKQNEMKAKQDEFESEQKSITSKQSESEVNQNLTGKRQNEFAAKQNEMEAKQNLIMTLIEELKIKQRHLEQLCDRKNIETTSVAVDTKLDNLNLVSQELKTKYQRKYGKVQLQLYPRRSSFQPVPSIERNKIVVKLSVVPTSEVYTLTEGIEAPTGKYTEAQLFKIEYKDIFEFNSQYVLISGDPGCGKTTLMESILYQWSANNLWTDKFDFLFVVYFRQLVKFRNDDKVNCQKLLSYFYPGFDFSQISHTKSLLILDGFDEFACKEDFAKGPEEFSPFVQAVYELVDPNNPCIQFTRMLTSRPGSFQILFDTVFKQMYEKKLRILKIIGFDSETIQHYVHNHLKNPLLADKVSLKLENSPNLRKLMAIPFYCWGICYLLNNEELTVETMPVTTTAIHANLLTLFIRNHGIKQPAKKHPALFKMEEFKKMIMMLSKMAWMLYKEKKLLFSSNDLKELGDLHLLVQSGLVMKVSQDFEEFDHFLFLHYSSQEFLCALHIFYGGVHLYDFTSRNITTMLFGLYGGKVHDSRTDVVLKLYASMITIDSPGLILNDSSVVSKLCMQVRSSAAIIDLLLFADLSILIKYFYEFQNPLSVEYAFFSNIMPGNIFGPNEAELNFFEEQCKRGSFSINQLIYTAAPADKIMFNNALICCNVLVIDTVSLPILKTHIDLNKVRTVGRFKRIDFRKGFKSIQELFEIVDVMQCFDCVEMTDVYRLLSSNPLKVFEVIQSMEKPIRPRSLIFRIIGVDVLKFSNSTGNRLIKAFDCCYEVGFVLSIRKKYDEAVIDIFKKAVLGAQFEHLKVFKIGYWDGGRISDLEDWKYHGMKIFNL